MKEKIEELRADTIGFFCGNIDFETNMNENVITEFIEKLDNLTALIPQWISVEDKLPKLNERIMFYGISYEPCFPTTWIGAYQKYMKNGKWEYWFVSEGHFVKHKVTHWQPLPQPPKED